MRIHTDTLTRHDVGAAAKRAGDAVDATFTEHGSRKRGHAFNVSLTGSSSRRPNSGYRGADSDDYAATWDEWGMFIAELFRRDPHAIVGIYSSEEHFHYVTGARFYNLTPANQHGRSGHRWEYVSPWYFECKSPDCTAVQRTDW